MIEEPEDLILYLDDEEANLMTFQYSLEKYYSIQLANNAKKAFEILESHQIKVMIVDQRMPDFTGLEVIAKARVKYPNIIFIVLTAHADLELTLEAINQGGIFQFLTKPWEINNLRNTINNAIEKYNLQIKNKDLFLELQQMNTELQMYNEELLATTDVLKDHENKFRTLFENSTDAILLMKDGKFVDCNKNTLEIFGCKREDIIGKSPIKFSPEFQPNGESSDKSALRKINSALEGGKMTFEWKHTQLNGNPFEADISLNRIELNGEIYLQAIVKDITIKKKAEKEFKESNTRNIFLGKSAIELTELNTINEIYTYISNTLFEMINHKGIISITEFDNHNDTWQIVSTKGIEKTEKEIEKILGFNIMRLKGLVKTEHYEKIATGKFTILDFDLSELTNNMISKTVDNKFKKFISFENLFCIALKYKEEVFGNISFITNLSTKDLNVELIESFVLQASLFLKVLQKQ